MLASAISTGVIVKITNLVTKHGHDIGLAATRGNRFIGMTWYVFSISFFPCRYGSRVSKSCYLLTECTICDGTTDVVDLFRAATILVLLASITWFVEIIIGRKRQAA